MSTGLRRPSCRLPVISCEEDGQASRAELGRVEVDHPRNFQLDALDAGRRRIDLAVDGQHRVELDHPGGGRRPAHVHLEDSDAAAGIVWQTRAAAREDRYRLNTSRLPRAEAPHG